MSLLKALVTAALVCSFFCTQILRAAVITFSPGIIYENNSRTQTILLETAPQDLNNRYVANSNWSDTFSAQLFLGKDLYQQKYVNMRFGLTLGFVDDSRMSGIVQQFALPDFDNMNYQYEIQSLTAMATLQIHLLANDRWQPYVDGSLGIASNNASNYQETSRINGAVPMSPYGEHHTNSFAYSVGAGLMYNLNPRVAIGLGYQFSDLGRARLGVSEAQQTTQTPTINHLLLQQLLLNISWRI